MGSNECPFSEPAWVARLPKYEDYGYEEIGAAPPESSEVL
jgi:hypothetical protein